MKCALYSLLFLILASPISRANPADDSLREQVDAITESFEKENYEEVVSQIDALNVEGRNAAFLQNLKGAAYTKLEDYANAKKSFEAALDASPGMFSAVFNLGEILFLQKQYEEALAWFRGMLAKDPKNELLQFKVVLCELQLENSEAAKKSLRAMTYPGDTPAWYYAHAAWELTNGERGRASDYLAGARYIFPGKTKIFEETFSDLGLPTR